MTLRSRLGAIRRNMWEAFYKREVALGDIGPIVTFTFDDFPRSALMVGAPIIERVGGHATFYVSWSRVETVNQLGEQFREDDLRTLLERGHEVANHTFAHTSAQRTSFSEFERDVRLGWQALRDRLGTSPSNNFAFPYGEVTLRAKNLLASQLASSRSTCGGLNGPSVDLNLLRANALYGGIEKAEVAQQLIQENVNRRTWLIFYTHDVSETPSPFGCTPELLEEVVSYASTTGNRILGVEKVLRELNAAKSAELTQHRFEIEDQNWVIRS